LGAGSIKVLTERLTFVDALKPEPKAAAGFPQQLSIFLAGGFASHFGGFSQVTYNHSTDHFSCEDASRGYARRGRLARGYGTPASHATDRMVLADERLELLL
jgi:hypothetical protein